MMEVVKNEILKLMDVGIRNVRQPMDESDTGSSKEDRSNSGDQPEG